MISDRSRLEYLALLDDRDIDYLRQEYAAAYQAVRDSQDGPRSVSVVGEDAVSEFDGALEWLLRWSGVPARLT